MKILVTYGTIGGNTYIVSQKLTDELTADGHDATMIDMELLEPEQLLEYEMVFMGVSTWDEADYNEFARVFFEKFNVSDVSLKKQKVALFGLGDTFYGHAYCASVPVMKKDVNAKGAQIVGEPFLIDGPPGDEIMDQTVAWAREIIKKL